MLENEAKAIAKTLAKEFKSTSFYNSEESHDESEINILELDELIEKRIKQFYEAIRDVSSEKKPNLIKEQILNGEITSYGIKELNRAQLLYNEIVKCDLESGMVDASTIKICKDPESVYRDIKNSNDPFQTDEKELYQLTEKDYGNINQHY